jgi:hypothetical protein
MLNALQRRSGLAAAFGGSRLAGRGNLKSLAFQRRDDGRSLKSLDRFDGLDHRRYRFRDMDRRSDMRGSPTTIRRRRKHFAVLWPRSVDLGLDGSNVVVVLEMFQKIADVQEGVAIEADIHEGRLHAGKNPGDAAFVETSD